MKLTIIKCSDRIKLVKFFRFFTMDLALREAIYRADHLPFTYEDLPPADIREIEKEIRDFAEFVIEDDDYDNNIPCGVFMYNLSINPPQEYVDAMAWYDTLSEKEKNHIEQIIIWKNLPGG